MSIRPTLIAYTTKTKNRSDLDGFRVTFSNPTFFHHPPREKYEYFVCESDEIRETLKITNPEMKEYKGEAEVKHTPKSVESKVKEASIEKVVEPEPEVVAEEPAVEIPDDYAELSWPKLRALASKFTDEGKFTKEEALEILAKAKGE